MTTDSSLIRRLDRLTNVLLGLMLFIPFVISAGALTDMARQHGMSLPWLFPFMIDGGLIIFKAQALRSSLRGKRDWYTWAMAVALTAVSVLLNVLHVPRGLAGQNLARLMAALPPLDRPGQVHGRLVRVRTQVSGPAGPDRRWVDRPGHERLIFDELVTRKYPAVPITHERRCDG